MTETVRYELRTDEEFIERLDRVSIAAGLTKPEAIWAGIDLLERLVEADKQGKEFALVDKQKAVSPDDNSKKTHYSVQIRVDDNFVDALTGLVDRLNKTEADVIRDALNYYNNAAYAWDKAYGIGEETT